jgi:hypothetical protein
MTSYPTNFNIEKSIANLCKLWKLIS